MNATIIGFDILPMRSMNARKPVELAVCILINGTDIETWNNVKIPHFLSLVNKFKPTYIGTDNPHEIILKGESIADLYRHFPSSSTIVHVNMTDKGRILPFKSVVEKHLEIQIKHKITPIETAEFIVKLISLGVGMKLEPFENETIVFEKFLDAGIVSLNSTILDSPLVIFSNIVILLSVR